MSCGFCSFSTCSICAEIGLLVPTGILSGSQTIDSAAIGNQSGVPMTETGTLIQIERGTRIGIGSGSLTVRDTVTETGIGIAGMSGAATKTGM